MKFALVNGYKTEPQPGLVGNCINCQSNTISKCGQVKIWHWAHKNKLSCDPWWENETEWHRAWKNQFPTEWQENIHIDSITGEKHIADIKTTSGLVIEFQHSALMANTSGEIKYRVVGVNSALSGTGVIITGPEFTKALSKCGININ